MTGDTDETDELIKDNVDATKMLSLHQGFQSGNFDRVVKSMVDKSLLAVDSTQVKRTLYKQLVPGNRWVVLVLRFELCMVSLPVFRHQTCELRNDRTSQGCQRQGPCYSDWSLGHSSAA